MYQHWLTDNYTLFSFDLLIKLFVYFFRDYQRMSLGTAIAQPDGLQLVGCLAIVY